MRGGAWSARQTRSVVVGLVGASVGLGVAEYAESAVRDVGYARASESVVLNNGSGGAVVPPQMVVLVAATARYGAQRQVAVRPPKSVGLFARCDAAHRAGETVR